MTQGSRRPVTFSVRAADSPTGEAQTQQVPLPPPAAASPGSSASGPDARAPRRGCPAHPGMPASSRSLRDRAGPGVGLHRVARRTAWLGVVADRPGSVWALPRHQQPSSRAGCRRHSGARLPTHQLRAQPAGRTRAASTALAADATVVNKLLVAPGGWSDRTSPAPEPNPRDAQCVRWLRTSGQSQRAPPRGKYLVRAATLALPHTVRSTLSRRATGRRGRRHVLRCWKCTCGCAIRVTLHRVTVLWCLDWQSLPSGWDFLVALSSDDA